MRSRLLGVGLLALVLVAAGCGGGGKKSVSPATTSSTATKAPSLSGIASATNCRELADLGTKFSSAVGGTNSADVKKMAALLQEFAAKTPSSIRPDFKVLADAYSKIAEAVGNLKPGTTPNAAALAKLQTLAAKIDATKVAQASERISAWLQKNCHA